MNELGFDPSGSTARSTRDVIIQAAWECFRQFGPRKTKELMLTGDSMDVDEAHRLAVVERLRARGGPGDAAAAAHVLRRLAEG